MLCGVGDGGRAAQELRAAAVVQAHPQQAAEYTSHVSAEGSSKNNQAVDIGYVGTQD